MKGYGALAARLVVYGLGGALVVSGAAEFNADMTKLVIDLEAAQEGIAEIAAGLGLYGMGLAWRLGVKKKGGVT